MEKYSRETDRNDDLLLEQLQSWKREYQIPQMSDRQIDGLRQKMKEAERMHKQEQRKAKFGRYTAIAAALAGCFILLPNTSSTVAHAMEQIPILGQLIEVVTFRNYEYETDRNTADVEVPEIKLEGESREDQLQEKLERTTEEINADIRKITDRLVAEFEANLDEEGHQDIHVSSEVLVNTDSYFTLKLACYQGAGSGYQWNYYYTIDLETAQRLQMKDLFTDGADYLTVISENIKEQMREQMAADENVYYWLDDEIEEWNFKSITDETNFYLNEKGNIVIGFNEGDVAPMYMGALEFEIPAEALSSIRK